MEYRCIWVDDDCMKDIGFVVILHIQVKKWYGWVTIRIINGPMETAFAKANKILYELRND